MKLSDSQIAPTCIHQFRMQRLLKEAQKRQCSGINGLLPLNDAFVMWETQPDRYFDKVPEYLDILLDTALDNNALMCKANALNWAIDTLENHDRIPSPPPLEAWPGEFGLEEAKLLSHDAMQLVDSMADVWPSAFTGEHVKKMLDVARWTEGGLLCALSERNVYTALQNIARHDATLFTRRQIGEITAKLGKDMTPIAGARNADAYRVLYFNMGISKRPTHIQHMPLDPSQPIRPAHHVAAILSHTRRY